MKALKKTNLRNRLKHGEWLNDQEVTYQYDAIHVAIEDDKIVVSLMYEREEMVSFTIDNDNTRYVILTGLEGEQTLTVQDS